MADQLNNVPASATAPGEGEQRAQRGYFQQYSLSGAAIYDALEQGDLEWVGLADRTAGIADDLVLGYPAKVVGHQFKTSQFPRPFHLRTLLMGANGLLQPLVVSWQVLRRVHPGKMIEIRFVTNDFPSTTDKLIEGNGTHSAAFIADFAAHPACPIADLRASRWKPLIDELCVASGLGEHNFGQFLQSLRILHGSAADFVQVHHLKAEGARLAGEIAKILPRLVADRRNKDRWTRAELLRELGWRDSAVTHHVHQFPVRDYVQRNETTESALLAAIQRNTNGYVSLVGPPGAGKSTLLQTSVETEENMFLARYLAFVPGVGQGVGRGEADDFFDDITTQLKRTGLRGLRYRDQSLHERRKQFNVLLQEAGERFTKEGIRTIIVIDGLDHVPREERPERSFLAELPLPASVPDGVLFLLGTQRVDLSDMKPAIQDQAGALERSIVVAPLTREAVHRMADLLDLDASIDRDSIFQLSRGHPLVTRYLIEALRGATAAVREELLAGTMTFDGDIESVYESSWRGIHDDEQACSVLDYLARAEGPMPLELLTKFLPEQAVERALDASRHLLAESSPGWSVFHNSFRLFIMGKPRLRLGKPDMTNGRSVYQNLAALARSAPSNSPQRWLELRYLARAEEHESVLALATPVRFRQQLADHRSIEELIYDLRLAFASAKYIYNPLKVFQLLLIQDEIDRRWWAFKESSFFVRALLDVGDLDGAVAFVEQAPSEGYAVVDALLDAGDFQRARALFEKLEPLKQLMGGISSGNPLRISELRDWVQRVIYFRDADQILQAIRRLSNTARMQQGLEINQKDVEELDIGLRLEAALAVIRAQESVNIIEVGERFGIDSAALVALTVEAGIVANERGSFDSAIAQFQESASRANFSRVSNERRRAAALIAARNGNLELAGTIFEGLASPSLAKLYEVSFDPPDPIIRAVLEHAELVTILDRTPAAIPHFESENLRLLQSYAEKIGQLLGKARLEPLPRYSDEVANVARRLLRFLSQLQPHIGGEFYEVRRIALVTPILGKALIQAAAMWGEQEFSATVAEFDRAFPDLDRIIGTLTNLRQEIAVEIYRWTGDSDAASRRLVPMVEALLRSTPAEQIDELANLAICFSQVGNVTQAKKLLSRLSDESLGYALPPKKDPQYATWRDLLQHANETDPVGRPNRVATLMHQLTGMMQTEGRAAAYRIAAPLLKEAAMCDAQTGWRVGQMLIDQGVIGWSRTVDGLLFGLVKRRPDLVMAATIVWCELSLPYYVEPHYSETNLGAFIEAAIAAASQEELEIIAERFLVAIETESQVNERDSLLDRLYKSLTARGVRSHALEEALVRWKAEAPPPRHSSSPRRYDDVTSLLELKTKLEQDEVNGELSYEAAQSFTRLAPNSDFNLSKELFDRWDTIKQDSAARFIVINLAIDSGRHDVAYALMEGYESEGDDLPKWTEWTGGKSLRYFKTKLRLEGSKVHKEAYNNFVGELAKGREWINSVLLETDEIFSTITETPDWVGMWDALVEQLATTREHALGSPFDKGDSASLSDEDLLVSLFTWAISLPLDELRRHSLSGALRLVEMDNNRPVFKQLVRRLLAGKDDDPVVGIQLLLLETNDLIKHDLERDVLRSIYHADFAVSEPAFVLAQRWGLSPSQEAKELPSFYLLSLDGDDTFKPPQLVDAASGAMVVEDPLGWTSAFENQINLLTNSGVSAAHIRYRCRMFIEEWGGLDTFGKYATKRLDEELHRLNMRMTFYRPHIAAAARGLRYVAGELRRGGVIPESAIPDLLYMMGYSAPQPPLIRPVSRPSFTHRPTIDYANWSTQEEEWLNGAEGDTQPFETGAGTVIAEVSEFHIRRSRAIFHMHRVRASGLELDEDDRNFNGFELLPSVYWLGQVYSPSSRPAQTIACNLLVSLIPQIPRNRLTICPHWLERLSWHSHSTNDLVFLDRENILVAQIVWWRDGGPVDIDDDFIWGQGMYLSLTPEGRQQLEMVIGPLNVRVHVRRSYIPGSRNESEKSRLAESRD